MGAVKAAAAKTGVRKPAAPKSAKELARTVVKTTPAKSAAQPAAKVAKAPAKGPAKAAAPVAAPKIPAAPAAKEAVKQSAMLAGKSAIKSMETPQAVEAKPVPKAAPAPARRAPGRLLTEEEILKAPEDEYMNDAQLAFFRDRLQRMEGDILRNAGETTEHLRETIIVPDPADRATIEEEHALELRTRDRERKLLKKIQQSIVRIDTGDYGYCEETGEPIGVPRLLARPTATLSLEAQQRREMKQKLYGD